MSRRRSPEGWNERLTRVMDHRFTLFEARQWVDGTDLEGPALAAAAIVARDIGLPVPVAVEWAAVSIWPHTAVVFIRAGFTRNLAQRFQNALDVFWLGNEQDVMNALSTWEHTGIPPRRIVAYTEAGIDPQTAVSEWETRQASGENIWPALAMLAALTSADRDRRGGDR